MLFQEDIDPDSKVHGANMGPTWVVSTPQMGPMLAPWTVLSGDQLGVGVAIVFYEILFGYMSFSVTTPLKLMHISENNCCHGTPLYRINILN